MLGAWRCGQMQVQAMRRWCGYASPGSTIPLWPSAMPLQLCWEPLLQLPEALLPWLQYVPAVTSLLSQTTNCNNLKALF